MKVFSTESIWDKETQQFVEYYYIDGKECSLEKYDEAMQDETCENDELECDGDCDNCEFGDDEDNDEFVYEDEIDEIIDDYVAIIQDINGCNNCTRQALKNFVEEIIEMFGIEEIED